MREKKCILLPKTKLKSHLNYELFKLYKHELKYIRVYIHTILFYLYSASCQSVSFQMTDIFKEYLQKTLKTSKIKIQN